MIHIPIERIHNDRNIRAAGDVSALAASIRKHGIKTPLTVYRDADWDGFYHIQDGGRRLAAANILGLEQVPCEVAEPPQDDENALLAQFLVNFSRRNLNPVEQAVAIQRMTGFGRDVSYVADQLQLSEEWVAGRLKLLQLAPEVQDKVASAELSPAAAAELQGFTEEEQREIVKGGKLTVAAIRQRARELRGLNDKLSKGRPMPVEREAVATTGSTKGKATLATVEPPAVRWSSFLEDLSTIIQGEVEHYDDRRDAVHGVAASVLRWLVQGFTCVPNKEMRQDDRYEHSGEAA